MNNVIDKVCDEKHNSVDYKLDSMTNDINSQNERLRNVEEAIVMLTSMAENNFSKNSIDRKLIIIVLILAVVLCGIVLGPEITKGLLGSFGS